VHFENIVVVGTAYFVRSLFTSVKCLWNEPQVRLTYKGPYDTKENAEIKEKQLCTDEEGQVQ
jgi:hypothetical protein